MYTTAIPTKSNATTSATSIIDEDEIGCGGNSGLKGNHWWKKDITCYNKERWIYRGRGGLWRVIEGWGMMDKWNVYNLEYVHSSVNARATRHID